MQGELNTRWKISTHKQVVYPPFKQWRATAEQRSGKNILRVHREGDSPQEATELLMQALQDHEWTLQ